jgi:hypothetical protein
MADLTVLDEKLAEVLGLAQAAQTAAKKVATLARKEKETELVQLMEQMGDDAAKVQQRCDVVAGSRDGRRQRRGRCRQVRPAPSARACGCRPRAIASTRRRRGPLRTCLERAAAHATRAVR